MQTQIHSTIILAAILLLLSCAGCSTDFNNPEEVVKKYRELTRTHHDVEIYDKYLSQASKETIDEESFVKLRAETDYKDELISTDVTEIKSDTSAIRRFKVVEATTNGAKPLKTVYYYSLSEENNNWKVIWAGKLLVMADEKIGEGNFSDAIKIATMALNLNPYDSRPLRKIANCYLNQEGLNRSDRELKAMQYFERAIEFEENNVATYRDIARYYLGTGGDLVSLKYFIMGSEFAVDDTDKSNFLANVAGIYFTMKKFDDAEKFISKSIELDSQETFNWFLQGKIFHSQNKISQAIDSYKEAVELPSMDSLKQGDLFCNYSSCLLSNNDCESATYYFNRSMDIIPSNENNESILSTLKQIRPRLLECFLLNQKEFEQAQKDFNKQYQSTSNQVKASYIFNEANNWSERYMAKQEYEFKNWQGKVATIYTDKGGEEATVTIESRIVIYHARISYNDSVYKMLINVDEGRMVIFSGSFIRKENLLQERSVTESGRMYNPEFEIILTAIDKK